MNCVRIRKASSEDATVLIDLSARTIRACYPSFLGDEATNAYLDSGAVDDYVRDNIHRCWVIVTDERIAGLAVCRGNLIDLMMIDHECHRRGLGSRLLSHVEAALFENHLELKLESFEPNEQANSFYRKHGWVEMERFPDESSGVNKIAFGKVAACDRSSAAIRLK